ncbi:HBR011Wp [Eremothecium sinecaudum]|uniref:HBR011Wp n=1 Tax=Eremothecium sinecaudum TaxID=45286 RepID=A0A109UX36_9SACH|nr:HBR011Wp [Eremothecium sinecaudum]AMD18912.1 HBR011Wp [Eremothecium sinecaudum]
METDIELVLRKLLDGPPDKSLIFVLGSRSRYFFESELPNGRFAFSSLRAVDNSRRNIKVMFLEKLQYLFIYLTKFEAEGLKSLKQVIIYGLDELIKCNTANFLSASQVRLANLIYSISFRVMRRHNVTVQFVLFRSPGIKDFESLENYWRYIT